MVMASSPRGLFVHPEAAGKGSIFRFYRWVNRPSPGESFVDLTEETPPDPKVNLES